MPQHTPTPISGYTADHCQDALVETVRSLFEGHTFNGQQGRKPLNVFKQNLPIPEDNDSDVDTDACAAPYVLVEANKGQIESVDAPQEIEVFLTICAYDESLQREGAQDVVNIREKIIQHICAVPYFGGAFTIRPPIAWAMQTEDTHPYYFGAVRFFCTAPALTQDNVLEDLV